MYTTVGLVLFSKALINKRVFFCWWQQWQQNNTFSGSENKNLIIPQFAELSKLNFCKVKKGFFPATATTKLESVIDLFISGMLHFA